MTKRLACTYSAYTLGLYPRYTVARRNVGRVARMDTYIYIYIYIYILLYVFEGMFQVGY